jgi:hypothetical protein
MINHNMRGCQAELKIAEAGSKAAGKLKKRRKSPRPLLRGKERIMKDIHRK